MEQLMPEPPFLATTALPEFWDPEREILFLGPWCRRQDRRRDWEGLRAQTLPSPWEDRERFHAAAEYLDRRMEQILPPLAERLNSHLGHPGDLRYWRILIGTWLMHSLQVAYDRYVHLSEALKRRPDLKTLLLDPACFRTPADTHQAVNWMMTDDPYNLQLFSQLMTGMGCSFPARALRSAAPADRSGSPAAALKQKLRGALRGAQSALSQLLEKRAQAGLIEMYCPASVVWTLSWKSGFKAVPSTLPESNPRRAGEPAAPLLQDRRRSALASLPATDEFLRLWIRSLPENFPTLYLEGFQAARERALRRLRHAPHTLVSATGWHYSEPFKFFAAEHSRRGGRLVAVQHGSGYSLFRSMPMEQHERRISDSFLGWEEAPSLQLAGLRARRPNPTAGRQRLLFVTTTNPRYPFRFYSAPQAHQLEDYFDWQARFLKSLGPLLRSRMVIRLHPLDFGHCLRQRLERRLPGLRWDRRRSFAGSAAKSRMLVVDHPGTPMLTALSGNFPTLLFWDPRLWEFGPEAQSHLELLRQAGLFQDDPEAAAAALEKILLEGPERWWSRAPVQAARRRFVERYAPSPSDWLRVWAERAVNQ